MISKRWRRGEIPGKRTVSNSISKLQTLSLRREFRKEVIKQRGTLLTPSLHIPFFFYFFFFIQLTNRTGQQEERESNPSDRCDPKLKSIFGRKWSNSCQKLGGSLLERRETLDEKVIYLFGWLRKLVTRGGDLPTWWW